jgi:hypothetical protein
MKLDKLTFANLIAYCVANGLSYGMEEIQTIDDMINFEVPQPTTYVSIESVNNLLAAMKTGKKIEAIKAYRTLSKAGLKEAKDAVEFYWTYPIGEHPEYGKYYFSDSGATLGDILGTALKQRQRTDE